MARTQNRLGRIWSHPRVGGEKVLIILKHSSGEGVPNTVRKQTLGVDPA